MLIPPVSANTDARAVGPAVDRFPHGFSFTGVGCKMMCRGRIVASESPEELRRVTGQENLQDAFVAAIGSEEGLL
jgi:hypothetical protein